MIQAFEQVQKGKKKEEAKEKAQTHGIREKFIIAYTIVIIIYR